MGNELVVERRTFLPVSAEDAWRWHAEPGWGAFERLAPPWRQVTMLERPAALADGARLTFRIAAGPFGTAEDPAAERSRDEQDEEEGEGGAHGVEGNEVGVR